MRVFLVNVAVLMLGIFVLEIFFGDWWLDNRLFLTRVPRTVEIEFESGVLYKGVERTLYKRDKYGLRGDYGDVSDIDILTLGGSTTDQRFIDETQTWQVHLTNSLEKSIGRSISIANAGIDGHSSYGHIASYEQWFSFIPKLRANYHLFYVGLNDKYEGLVPLSADYVDPAVAAGDPEQVNLAARIKEKSALYNAYLNARGFLQKRSNVGHYAFDFDQAVWIPMDTYEHSFSPEKDMPYIENYKLRISRIMELARKSGAIPIVVNQRGIRLVESMNQNLFLVEGDWSEEYSARIAWLERNYAKVTIDACKKNKGICIDLYNELGPEFTFEHFYDPDHNTPAGTRLIGEYLGAKLYELFNQEAK